MRYTARSFCSISCSCMYCTYMRETHIFFFPLLFDVCQTYFRFTFALDMNDDASMLDSDFACLGSLTSESGMAQVDGIADAFIGRLSHFKLNGLDLLQLIGELPVYRAKESAYNTREPGRTTLLENWKENVEVTAVNAPEGKIPAFPIQFEGGEGLFEAPLGNFRHHDCVKIRFTIKTGTVRNLNTRFILHAYFIVKCTGTINDLEISQSERVCS